MNKIRRRNNGYEVLHSPHQKYNTGFEFLLGSWTDEGLKGFEISEYETLTEAQMVAAESPDINWEQLYDYHIDSFQYIKDLVNDVIKKANMTVQLKTQLLKPDEIKNKMFDRVSKGDDFRLVYDMNDIVSFSIINPWTKNLDDLETYIVNNERLAIFQINRKNGITHLIGRTSIGTTYEILLIPNMVSHWMEWKKQHPDASSKRQIAELKNCLNIQRQIDTMPILR